MKSFLATLALCLPLQAFASGYSFTPLFDSHEPDGARQIIPDAISHDGTKVVGGASNSSNGNYDFLWERGGGITRLPPPSEPYYSATRPTISGDGFTIATNAYLSGESRPFQTRSASLWTKDSGYRNALSSEDLPNNIYIMDSSYTGMFHVGYESQLDSSSNVVNKAVRITNGQVEYLGALNAANPESRSFGISSDGQIVVGRSINQDNNLEAFVWTPQTGQIGLGVLEGFLGSSAFTVSSDGNLIAGALYDTNYPIYEQAFFWSQEDGMIHIPTPDGFNGLEAFAISDNGTVFGAAIVIHDSRDRAFLWDQTNGLQYLHEILEANDIDLLGWQLMGITDVTPDGKTLVGYGQTPDGRIDAFIATIPEPLAALWLLPLGLIALVCYRRTK